VDQVSLLETNGEWRIISTVFKVTPKASKSVPLPGRSRSLPCPLTRAPALGMTAGSDDSGLEMTPAPSLAADG
jgi:hypothetical protein